jgi:hypothetical protein
MTCDDARELMHEALDGCEGAAERLEAHLAQCDNCVRDFDMLQRTQEAVAAVVGREPSPERLERAAIAALAVGTPAQRSPWVAAAIAASVLLAFGIGILAGRSVWPREVIRTVRVPNIVEKVVEREVRVEVPVVEERVVVKRVPVIRERVVYRDGPIQAATKNPVAVGQPVMPEEREVRIEAEPLQITIARTEEVTDVPVMDDATLDAETTGSDPEGRQGKHVALTPPGCHERCSVQ